MLDAIASERHFADHLAPVWDALPESERGQFWAPPEAAADILRQHGIRAAWPAPPSRAPTLVAAVGDLQRSAAMGRPTAIMEHGAGFSFGGDLSHPAARNPSYAGGSDRPARLFLHPGIRPAARDKAAYPAARVELIGCPKLDTLPRKPERGNPPVVAVSFHWDCPVAPETRSAFLWVRLHIPKLTLAGFRVIGHGHPRIFERAAVWYRENGIEPVRDFEEVCARADLYVSDASSTLYEFAATGRPVVVLDPPFYRREVDHGLRFWEAADVGIRVTEPAYLARAAAEALRDGPDRRRAREAALDLVYAHRSGAAARAALFLLDWMRDP